VQLSKEKKKDTWLKVTRSIENSVFTRYDKFINKYTIFNKFIKCPSKIMTDISLG